MISAGGIVMISAGGIINEGEKWASPPTASASTSTAWGRIRVVVMAPTDHLHPVG